MKEFFSNLRSKMRSSLNVNNKINFNSVLGVVAGILIAISTLGIYINKNMIYVVKVKDKSIGYIQDKGVYNQVVGVISKSDGLEVTKSITLKKTLDNTTKFLSSSEIEKIARQDLKLKMPGVIMYADGKEIARVANVAAIKSVEDGVGEYYKSRYSSGKYKVISNDIKEKITTSSTLLDPKEIQDVDEAIKGIVNGKGEQKIYTIKQGDTIWDVALKNNISIEQIQAANAGKNLDKIQIDDKIKLAVIEPYLHVETVLTFKTTEPIPYTTKIAYDKKKAKGYKSVSQKGKSGKSEIEKKITIVNGDVAGEEVINNKVLVAAVAETVVMGTKKATYVASGGTGRFGWPVRGLITSRYGRRWREFHTGLDIAVPRGTGVKAADGGVVSFAGWNGGYGLCVMIKHGNGYQTLYGHMSKLNVRSGQKVSKGQKIGSSGSTGRSTGPHVHFEVRKNGSNVNPSKYLN